MHGVSNTTRGGLNIDGCNMVPLNIWLIGSSLLCNEEEGKRREGRKLERYYLLITSQYHFKAHDYTSNHEGKISDHSKKEANEGKRRKPEAS